MRNQVRWTQSTKLNPSDLTQMDQIHKKARSCMPSYWRGIDSDYGPWSRMMSVAVDIKASNSIYALADRNTANIDDRTTIRRNPNWRLQFATLCNILCLDDFLKTPTAFAFVQASYGLRFFFTTFVVIAMREKELVINTARIIAMLILRLSTRCGYRCWQFFINLSL